MEKKKLSILIITLIGFLTTVKLALIYYNANFNDLYLGSFCSVNDFIDCDGIAKTIESQFLGIPLAFWGMFLYIFMLIMLFCDKLKKIKFLKFLEVFKNPYSYIAILGIVSFIISIILLCLSLFEIKKICILCAFTYLLNLLIAIISVHGIGFKNAIQHCIEDCIEGIKIKKYAIALGLVLLVIIGFLTYTRISYVFAPQVKHQVEFKEFTNGKISKYFVTGNVLGSENPDVVINTYTDYNCPMCKAYNIMIHKLALKEYKNIRIIHHNLPLDTECNKYLRQEFHHGSCTMAKYAIAAEKQGKLWEMNDKLFENQPKDTKEILKIAEKLNLNIDKLQDDANSIETMKIIQKEIDEAWSQKIYGTPTTVINREIKTGIKPYKTMKEWLTNAGAK